jgi:hypothetical protein
MGVAFRRGDSGNAFIQIGHHETIGAETPAFRHG